MLPLLALICVCGAYLSKRTDLHWAWLYVPALASASVWIRIARAGGHLSTAASTFDVVAAAAYLVTYVAMGERPTAGQWAGVCLAVFGCWLMGRG